jgi:POT family proton-dependent oligopeptide transporter
MPLIGAYIADTRLGRFNTICLGIAIALVGHLLFIISALPPVIKDPSAALAPFTSGIIINGIGTGFFKSTVSPLIAEQIKADRQYLKVLPKTGERVIVDPTITAARLFDYFYLMINIGALGGQVAMPFAEKYVGYWLAYLLPTIVFLICIPVLYFARNKYVKSPPTGSVVSNAFKLLFLAGKGRFSWNPVQFFKNLTAADFWENVKPSKLGSSKPAWMTFDDQWVEEVRRGYKACYIFLLFPFYWLAYSQISGNLISQGATMTLNGVPNEIPSNLDPFSIILFVPLFEYGLYPMLRYFKINFTALQKIFAGFMFAAAAMVWAAVTQHYIYKTSTCGNYAGGDGCISPISVWTQVGSYSLVGISELFASVVSLEIAFTLAPRNMRSLVMSVGLFTTAIGSAIQEAFIPLTKDPLLVWMYTSIACITFCAGVLFAIMYRGIDRELDYLYNLSPSKYVDPNAAQSENVDVEQNHHSVSTPSEKESAQ